ncbi:MAG: EamA family transporter RarD [Chitinophagaceae bacterium]
MNRGYLFAIAAYTMWGLLPIYWQRLREIPATQVVAHRILWSCLFLIPLVMIGGYWPVIRQALKDRKVIVRQSIAAILVCANWLGFVWAVTHDRIVESSLGYFINPLLSVLLAVAILGERLRWKQWMSIGIAALGVVWLTVQNGTLPWVVLMLASTFCLYAFVKKTTSLHPIVSLSIETWALLIPALIFLGMEHSAGRGGLKLDGGLTDWMLVGAGVATTIPLLCFAAGAQRIPLSVVGLLQYIGPTIQFTLGTLVYNEPFNRNTLIGFCCVWIALAIYASDSVASLLHSRAIRSGPKPKPTP